MKSLLIVLLFMCLGFSAACAEGTGGEGYPQDPGSVPGLMEDLVAAYLNPSGEALAKVDADMADTNDPLARSVSEHWKEVWLDPDYRMYLFDEDDPSLLPVTGKHAFVILGYALVNGQITPELAGRCDAAAEAARAFPDSILVCSGGATGANNPDEHTEAGMMKEYLSGVCGIDAARIFTDERALTTADNARYTMNILETQKIETITIITSAYHQKRGQTLFNALAAKRGYPLKIVGNYNYPMDVSEDVIQSELPYTISQITELLELPDDAMDPVWTLLSPGDDDSE